MRMCAHRKKEATNVYIEKNLKEAAKEEGLNLSRAHKNAIKEKIGGFSADAFFWKGVEGP